MAGKNHLIKRLAEIVATFDDAAWIALANKGLYRRARKDLEKGIKVDIGEETESGLQIQVTDFMVTLPETGPSQATCTCPSPGICQHILVACLSLKEIRIDSSFPLADEEHPPGPPQGGNEHSISSIESELLTINHKQLRKWAGSTDFRAAVKLASEEENPVIEAGNPLVIKLTSVGVVCRYPAGTGPEGFIISGPTRKRKRFIAAAILVFQKLRGISLPDLIIKKTALQEEAGVPRTRQEVITSVQSLLEDSVTIGLAHLSASAQERFGTLAVSAQGVKLHRLSLTLRRIADEINLLLERSGQADVGRLFLTMTHLYALSEALKNSGPTPKTELLGWSKSHYNEMAALQLIGVGAYPWRTRSGYHGLTVLFWDNEGHDLFSWTDARPTQNSGGFNPVSRYTSESPWQGGQSPKELSRTTFTLMHGSKNPYNRLSASSQTQIVKTGSTRLQDVDFGDRLFTDWTKLLEYAGSLAPIGLKRTKPLQEVVFVKPAVWGERSFDHIQQIFLWWLADENGILLPLSLEYSKFFERSIQTLERMKPPKDGSWVLVAKIVRRASQIALMPYSVLKPGDDSGTVYNIALDSQPKAKWWQVFTTRSVPVAKESPQDWDDSEEEESEEFLTFGNLLDQHISELEGQLTTLAERGVKTLTDLHVKSFEEKAKIFQNCGLVILSQTIQRFMAASEHYPKHLFSTCYLTLLHRQAARRS